MSKRILVTGGAGYVGSHACKALAAGGYEPVVYDNMSQGHRWAVKWGPLVVGDIVDGALLRQTLNRFKISAVMHFAAHAYVGESVSQPRKYFANNVTGTLKLLEAMLECGVNVFVFSSSCSTYGVPQYLPISEDHPQNPLSPYGATKQMIEMVLRWYGDAYALRHVSLRYFNAAGADEEGEIGEEHDPETHLIPLVIAAARGKIDAVPIYGTDYDTPDGSAVRDYVHVSDLADAHSRAVDSLFGGLPNSIYNLGTGTGHSVWDIVRAVEAVSGRTVPTRAVAPRPGDAPALVASPALAKSVLGWRARRPELQHIVETAWRWYNEPRAESGIAGKVG